MIKVNPDLHTLVWGTEDWFNPGKPFEKLLFKIIDAKDKLSVQVHPDDKYAAAHEDGKLGKTEMWYILGAKPGAQLVYGLKEGITKDDFAAAVEAGTVEETLNFVDVSKGDIYFITPGLVHAIGEGITLAELQENVALTYRVYDYNRQPPRELHIDKAMDVLDPSIGRRIEGGKLKCEYFSFKEWDVLGEMTCKEDCLIFPVSGEFGDIAIGELFQASKGDRIFGNGKVLIMK